MGHVGHHRADSGRHAAGRGNHEALDFALRGNSGRLLVVVSCLRIVTIKPDSLTDSNAVLDLRRGLQSHSADHVYLARTILPKPTATRTRTRHSAHLHNF